MAPRANPIAEDAPIIAQGIRLGGATEGARLATQFSSVGSAGVQ